ncbi:MAG: dehydrogenase E1 component subunit alpha/beta [Bacteroidota bacterium]
MPSTTTKLPSLTYQRAEHAEELLLSLYEQLLLPRMIEEKMLKQLRQGIISKWFSGIGQEAINVGVTTALEEDEFIFTMHRNLGVFTSRGLPLGRLFAQWQGKPYGYTQGRDRSFHFGVPEHHIVGMISHLGPQLSLAAGVALQHKLQGEKKVSVAFTGDGGTSQGEFHEALNTAAVWQLPVIFIVENNGYGLSTPISEQYACESLTDRGVGYGMRSLSIDGNNVLEVYETVNRLASELREKPEPVLLECRTFRVRGHEEASGTKYVPKELITAWQARDPITNFADFLKAEGIWSDTKDKALRTAIKKKIEAGLTDAAAAGRPIASQAKELGDVFAPLQYESVNPGTTLQEMRFVDAISDGLREGMRKHDDLVLMGQDIAEYGGVFKITDGFAAEFGRERVRNTPLCESGIIGIGLGMSIAGGKSMIEMQFGDFVSCGFNQIVNNLAKVHYRWGQKADVVIRLPSGGGVGAGPFHSQNTEAWFFHVPGLKIVYPSNPVDAKGLLLSSLADPNPVLFFEHKALYRSLKGEVPSGYYTTEIGKAKLVQEGKDLSIITYGSGVHWAIEATKELRTSSHTDEVASDFTGAGLSANGSETLKDTSIEILDLRSLAPLDYEAIRRTVRKTNKVIILHEDTLTGGIGGELAAWIGEHCFEQLDGPVVRLGAMDTPVPFAEELEKQFLPKIRLKAAIIKLLTY